MDSVPTVVVVDADPLVRSTVKYAAKTLNMDCKEFECGGEFLNTCAFPFHGCVVLELELPDISGLDVQREVLCRAPSVPVVFLAAKATVSIAVAAMRAGAMHVLQKPIRDYELLDTLQEATRLGYSQMQAERQYRESQERIDALSEAEGRLMELILAGESNRAIAEEFGVCLRTVEIRRSKLMKKLRVRSLAELVRLAFKSGETWQLSIDDGQFAISTRRPLLPSHTFEVSQQRESAWLPPSLFRRRVSQVAGSCS